MLKNGNYKEKICPRIYEHHRPKGLDKFAERVARNPYVKHLRPSVLMRSHKKTSILENNHPNELKIIYTSDGFAEVLIAETTAKNRCESFYIKSLLERELNLS